MSYEKMTDLGTDKVYALGGVNSKTNEKNPLQVEGYYLGSRNVQTTNGPSVIHVFQTPKGNEGVWGTKKLNDNLNKSVIGKAVLVKYSGKVKIAGGKTQHTYEFFVDRDNTIAVSEAAADEGFDDTDDSTGGDTDAADESLLTAQAEAQARQAKVQALLNKNKSK